MSDSDGSGETEGVISTPESFALIGADSNRVSIQLIQEIFREINGKNEALSESFSKPYQIEFSDIENLYHKIKQSTVQFNIIVDSFSAVIYHVNDQKDEFRSFDSLSFHKAGSSSPVESIFLKFDFLILLPKTRKNQTYSVSVRVLSRVALEKKFSADLFSGPSARIFRIMGHRTAFSKIEYVDYSVARNINSVITEWFSALHYGNENKIISYLQKKSHHIPKGTKFFGVLMASVFGYLEFVDYMPNHDGDLTYFGASTLSIFVIIYSSFVLFGWCGEFIENSIDSWSPLSYLNFNKGDEIEIKKYKRRIQVWERTPPGEGMFKLATLASSS